MNGKCGDIVSMILRKKFLNKKLAQLIIGRVDEKDDRDADFGNSSN